jgi:hypothetical protein
MLLFFLEMVHHDDAWVLHIVSWVCMVDYLASCSLSSRLHLMFIRIVVTKPFGTKILTDDLSIYTLLFIFASHDQLWHHSICTFV